MSTQMPKNMSSYVGGPKRTGQETTSEGRRLTQLERSLQIAGDARFKELVSFKHRPPAGDIQDSLTTVRSRHHGTSSVLARLELPSLPGQPLDLELSLSLSARSVAEGECSMYADSNDVRFSGRAAWEDALNSNVKRLVDDLQLTNDADCKLSQLERLHQWFQRESRKHPVREAPRPNFTTFERHQRLPPGSAREVPQPSNLAMLDLAQSMGFRRVDRLKSHFGVVPCPPPPGPRCK